MSNFPAGSSCRHCLPPSVEEMEMEPKEEMDEPDSSTSSSTNSRKRSKRSDQEAKRRRLTVEPEEDLVPQRVEYDQTIDWSEPTPYFPEPTITYVQRPLPVTATVTSGALEENQYVTTPPVTDIPPASPIHTSCYAYSTTTVTQTEAQSQSGTVSINRPNQPLYQSTVFGDNGLVSSRRPPHYFYRYSPAFRYNSTSARTDLVTAPQPQMLRSSPMFRPIRQERSSVSQTQEIYDTQPMAHMLDPLELERQEEDEDASSSSEDLMTIE